MTKPVPSFEELVTLNPRLAAKPHDEVRALVQTIRDCGYKWDSAQKVFFHPELSVSIRTQGLDYITPERFREAHERQRSVDPQARRVLAASKTHAGVGCWVIGAALGWAAVGWVFTDRRRWLLGIGALMLAFVVVYGRSLRLARRAARMQGL